MAKKKSGAVAKAEKAEKAVKKGIMKKVVKKRFSVTFHRPATLKKDRAPLYPRKRCVAEGVVCGACSLASILEAFLCSCPRPIERMICCGAAEG